MTNVEFKIELNNAFKIHMFMKERTCHTINELLYVLECHAGFNGEDFNISIKRLDKSWIGVPTLDCFVDIHTRSIWFKDEEVEFDVDEFEIDNGKIMRVNCITISECEKN